MASLQPMEICRSLSTSDDRRDHHRRRRNRRVHRRRRYALRAAWLR